MISFLISIYPDKPVVEKLQRRNVDWASLFMMSWIDCHGRRLVQVKTRIDWFENDPVFRQAYTKDSLHLLLVNS
jgi:hypothetical protein